MHRTEVRVRFGETDPYGVVYFTSYLEYAKTALDECLRTLGLSPAQFYRNASGGWPIGEVTIRYEKPARYDDLIRVETTLADVSSRTVTFDYAILNADSNDRLATARTTLVSLDASSRVATIPAEFRPMLRRAAGLPE